MLYLYTNLKTRGILRDKYSWVCCDYFVVWRSVVLDGFYCVRQCSAVNSIDPPSSYAVSSDSDNLFLAKRCTSRTRTGKTVNIISSN